MRQALNDNPVAQALIIGLLAIAVGFLLLTRVFGGSDAEESPAPASSQSEEGVVYEAEVSGEQGLRAADAAMEVAQSGDIEGAAEAFIIAAAGGFTPGPGLPSEVVDAYRDGKAVAVLVTRKRGIEDRRLRRMQARIRAAGNVAVFHAFARDISRYSRITGGVDVSRVPALVVIHPRKQSRSGIPVAAVSYGFRGPASAEQAVRDALYEGPRDIPYYPYPAGHKGR